MLFKIGDKIEEGLYGSSLSLTGPNQPARYPVPILSYPPILVSIAHP